MIDVENIVEVPGWTIDSVVSNSKKIKVTLSLPREIIGDRASNVVRGLDALQAAECPTFVGVNAPNESDGTQSVLPDLASLSEDVDEEPDSEETETDDENFIEVS